MADQLCTTLSALADPTRRAIVDTLTQGPANVSEIVDRFDLAQPTISKHLKVLEAAGLISRGKAGQKRPCQLETENLRSLELWLGERCAQWEARMDRFEKHVAKMKSENVHD